MLITQGRAVRGLWLLPAQGQASVPVGPGRPEAHPRRPRLKPGKHVLELDFKYDRLGTGTLAFNNMSGIGRGSTGVLEMDGEKVATQPMEHTLPLITQWDDNLDVGSDSGTPVDDQ